MYTRKKLLKISGFTIVELLIVIVVIAILAAISIVAYTGIQARAHNVAVQNDLKQTYTKMQEFYLLNDHYPASQADINSVFVTTRGSYGGGSNRLIYCRSNDAIAIVGRSVSGTGFYYSSVSGAGTLSSWPGDSHANLCPAAGIPTSSAGYAISWIYANVVWSSWFTPGR